MTGASSQWIGEPGGRIFTISLLLKVRHGLMNLTKNSSLCGTLNTWGSASKWGQILFRMMLSRPNPPRPKLTVNKFRNVTGLETSMWYCASKCMLKSLQDLRPLLNCRKLYRQIRTDMEVSFSFLHYLLLRTAWLPRKTTYLIWKKRMYQRVTFALLMVAKFIFRNSI